MRAMGTRCSSECERLWRPEGTGVSILRRLANKGFDQMVGHAPDESKCPPTGQSRRCATSRRNASSQWFGVYVLVGTLAFAGCGASDPCGNEILDIRVSPDARHQVIVFQRDCGATTGFTTQVSVLKAGEEFRTQPTLLSSTAPGNAFRSDKGGPPPPDWRGGGPWVQAAWTSGDPPIVRIRYDAGARVSTRMERVGDVRLEYEPSSVTLGSGM